MKKKILAALLLFSAFVGYSQGVMPTGHCDIFYATNAYELSNAQKDTLSVFVGKQHFGENDSIYFSVESYTDEKGPVQYNKALSEKRAKAVYDELLRLKSGWKQTTSKGLGIDSLRQEDSLQRHSTVTLYKLFVCGTREEKKDTLDLYNPNWFKNVNEYYTSKAMIKDEMYAVDINENILKTAGMISFELTDEALNSKDFGQRMISVCVPLKSGQKFDPEMKLWSSVINENGDIRWEPMEGDIQYDPKSNCYRCYFRCNNPKPGIIRINIDKRVNDEYIVYVSTFKDYRFTDVFLTDASFSAVLKMGGKRIFAFVTDRITYPETDFFSGIFSRNGNAKQLRVQLSKCDKSRYNHSDCFVLHKKTNYFINRKEYNKKGFVAWILRIFESGDNY